MKIIITENQEKNLNSYLRRIDRIYNEYMEQNWPKEELCDGPFSPEVWDESENGNVYDYFVISNMRSITGEILLEILPHKYGNKSYGLEEFSNEHNFIRDFLKKFGYEEKTRQYLYNTLSEC